MSLAACAGTAITARPIPAPRSVGNRRVRMALLLPAVSANGAGFARVSRDWIPRAIPTRKRALLPANHSGRKARIGLVSPHQPEARCPYPIVQGINRDSGKVEHSSPSQTTFIGMETMRSKLMLTLTVSAAALLLALANQPVWAQDEPALTGTVSSEAEGNMEGVVVTAAQPGSIVRVSVTTDAQGHYAFPQNRLIPGEYTISIRAVGYDIDVPTKAVLEAKKTRNLAGQLTNAEWMMSIPGSEEEKSGLLNCTGCHTLERVMRSTHDSDEWTHVISRMQGYGAVSQPIKPQPMLDRARAGQPEQYRKLANYLATINLSSADHWAYELKTLARPKGRDTRAVVTEYDMVRPTTEPHDILVDKEGNVWYTDFGEMFIGKFNPKTLKLTEYPIRKFKEKAPTGLLSIEFDHTGKIWFDTMYQGSLGCLDPKTGEIAYYPLPPEYNDDTVQLNFTGLRYDVDGKIWTKSVGTQHVFRLDLASKKWERFHPTDYLPDGFKNAGIYQVMSDSKNNLWMAEFTEGHLGKIDAKTTKVTWYPIPTPHARARRMQIDDQDRVDRISGQQSCAV